MANYCHLFDIWFGFYMFYKWWHVIFSHVFSHRAIPVFLIGAGVQGCVVCAMFIASGVGQIDIIPCISQNKGIRVFPFIDNKCITWVNQPMDKKYRRPNFTCGLLKSVEISYFVDVAIRCGNPIFLNLIAMTAYNLFTGHPNIHWWMLWDHIKWKIISTVCPDVYHKVTNIHH